MTIHFSPPMPAADDALVKTSRQSSKPKTPEQRARHTLLERIRREKNREKYRAASQAYRARHPDRVKESRRLERERDQANEVSRTRIWKLANPSRVAQHQKRYRARKAAINFADRPMPIMQAAAAADALFGRICSMVSRGLKPDIREDVISEIYLAVAEGKLTFDFNRTDVSKFVSRQLAIYANRFTYISLDERGSVCGRTLGERLGVY